MPDYAPSAKVRLGIRFEALGTRAAAPAGPKVPITAIDGVKSSRSSLVVQPDATAPAGVRRFTILPPGGPTASAPQSRVSSSDGLTHVIGGIRPKAIALGMNGVRAADTISGAIAFVDAPFYPETIQSMWVEVFIGNLLPDERERGILVPDTWIDSRQRQRTNRRFRGWIDKWRVSFKKGDVPVISFDGRDNTALLIDQMAPPGLVASAKIPLDQAVAGYLANFPQFAGLSVEYRGEGVPPTLERVLSTTAYRPELGPPAAQGGGGDKLSAWDYVTDLAGTVGLFAYLDDVTLVLQQPRSLYGAAFRSGLDPFGGGVRRMVHGRNLESLEYGRNYSKKAPQNVEVRCYDPAQKKTLVVRYPASDGKKKDVVSSLPGDGADEKKVHVHRVSGVKDVKILGQIAQGIYEALARADTEVHWATSDLSSYGAVDDEPDLLDARAGAPIEFSVARDEEERTTQGAIASDAAVASRIVERLVSLGHDRALAEAYARAYAQARVLTVYRLQSMTVKYDAQQGVAIEGTATNYLQVRQDPGDEPRVPASAAKAGSK